jgi:16S rRNA U1498 N3-methylase RsmE
MAGYYKPAWGHSLNDFKKNTEAAAEQCRNQYHTAINTINATVLQSFACKVFGNHKALQNKTSN